MCFIPRQAANAALLPCWSKLIQSAWFEIVAVHAVRAGYEY